MDSIKDIFNNFIDNRLRREKYYTVAAIVDEVNASGKVCDVTLITDEKVEGVRLQANLKINASGDVVASDPGGFVLVPSEGSEVLVTFSDRADAFVSMFSQIENVYIISKSCIFNEGENGGLINILDQTTKLNDLVNSLSQELLKIQTGITSAGGAYTPGVLQQFNKSDYEDDNIKH